MAGIGGIGPASTRAFAPPPMGADSSGAADRPDFPVAQANSGSPASDDKGDAQPLRGESATPRDSVPSLKDQVPQAASSAKPIASPHFAPPEPIGLLPDRAPNGRTEKPGLGARVADRVTDNFKSSFSAPLGPGQAYREFVDPFIRPSGNRFADAATSPLRNFNEALLLGAPSLLDAAGRTIAATYHSAVDAGTETLKSAGMDDSSANRLGRELKAMPEAFAGSPTMFARGAPAGAVAKAERQTGAGWVAGAADEAYQAIRSSKTDVADIAANTGVKPANVQKVKDHLFMNEHLLDRYVHLGVPAKVARFDSDAAIAAAWKRLETGSHKPADMQLLRHETAEAWQMRNVAPGYDASHTAAQRRYPAPEY